MTHTRIKICGITTPAHARSAIGCGAEAIGLVFYAGSKRAVSVEQAQAVVAAVPPFVSVVGLFVDESSEAIQRILAAVDIDLLQFHGGEDATFCRSFGRPWIKALRVKPDMDIPGVTKHYQGARGLLLDSWQAGTPGGTGKTFDWTLASVPLSMPIVLAGGLNEQNVGAAIAQVRPAAVDVSGGVESAPGVKDEGKIGRFVAAVRAADQQLDG